MKVVCKRQSQQHQLSHLDLATDVNLDDFQVVLNELDKTLAKPIIGETPVVAPCKEQPAVAASKDQELVAAGQYQCKLCPRMFNYASSLAYHNEVSHEQARGLLHVSI